MLRENVGILNKLRNQIKLTEILLRDSIKNSKNKMLNFFEI